MHNKLRSKIEREDEIEDKGGGKQRESKKEDKGGRNREKAKGMK